MIRIASVAAAAVVAAAGCSNLPELGVCGNGIVEAGEACDEDSDLCDVDCQLVCASHDQVVAAGVESEYVNLDPEDNLADARFCPDGYGCGVDTICRIGAARFRPVGDPVALDSDRVQVGDVDADDIADVIAIGDSQVSVLYGATDEDAFSTTAVLPGPIVTGRPFAADLDTDGATDLLIPSLSGLIKLVSEGGELRGALGLSTRSLPDVPGGIDPAHVEALVARAGPLGDRDASGIGFAQVDNGVAEFAVGGSGVRFCGAAGAELVAGVAQRTGALGDAFAVGIKEAGADSVCVFMPQADHTWTKYEVSLPPGLEIDPARGHLVFARLVANRTCPSLVVPVLGAAEPELVVVDGTEAPACPFTTASSTVLTVGGIADAALLAAGDFVPDGNGLDELVTSAGLATRDPATPFHYVFNAFALSTGGWSGAVVGDVDGDGRDDVVASQLTALAQRDHDLAVVLTRDDATFNPVVVDTLGAVEQIVSGDFDGNLAADVAFVEDRGTDPDTGEDANAVSVLYGNVGALPDAPLVFDTLTGEVRLISVGPRSGDTATVLEADALDDLGVVEFSNLPPVTEFGLGIAFGTAGRFLASPQWFGPSDVRVIGTVAADFGDPAETLDVGVFVRADTEHSCNTEKLPAWFWPDDVVGASCDDASAFPRSESFAVTSALNVAGDRVIVAATDGREVIADKFGGGNCPSPAALGTSPAAFDLAATDVDAGASGDELIAAFGLRAQNQSLYLIPAVDDCTVPAADSWIDLTAAAGRDDTMLPGCAAAVAVPPPLDGNADAGWATIVAACADHHLVALRHRDGALSPWGIDAEIDGDPITAVAGDFTGDGVDDVAVVARLGGIATLTVFAQCAATDQDPACGAR